MALPYTQSTRYTPPQIPQVRTGASWGMNAENPFGQNYQGAMFKGAGPATGVSTSMPQPVPMYRAPGPATGSTFTSQADLNAAAAAAGAGRGAAASSAAAGRAGLLQEQAQAGAMNTASNMAAYRASMPPMPVMNQPNYGPGYTPGPFQTQYGTLDNIQQYMNPYLDQIIERGNNNILASASARGLLGSTGTENQLGSWAAQAQADAYNDAWGRFEADRGYMTGVYQDGRNFDYNNYRDTNAWNYGLFSDERQDWNDRMQAWADQMNGITGVGINATNSAADVWGDYFKSLAALYGNQGDVGAMQAMMQGNNNNGLLGGILGSLGGLIGGK